MMFRWWRASWRRNRTKVSRVRGENLMIQTRIAIACEIIKKKLSMENAMTNTSDQIMFVKELEKIVKDQGLFRSLELLLQMLELAGHGDEEFVSATRQEPQ